MIIGILFYLIFALLHFHENDFVCDLKAEVLGNHSFFLYLVIIKCQNYIFLIFSENV